MTTAPVGDHGPSARLLAFTRIPWYPALIAAAYVLSLWVTSGVSVLATTRSLAVAVGAVTVITLVLTVVTRRPAIAGAVTTALFLIFVSREALQFVAVVVLIVAIPAALAVWARIRGRPLTWRKLTRALNALGAILLGFVILQAASGGELAAIPYDLAQGSPGLPASIDVEDPSGAGGPDILILLLDGYPRPDSFARLFGGDGREFTEGLEERGFAISESSQSNYPYTQATLTSMLHMRPLSEISELRPIVDGEAEDYPLFRLTLNANPTFGVLRERGYTVVASSPGYEHVTLRQADVFLDDGSLNEFERQLIRGTLIQLVTEAIASDTFLDQHRSRILASFGFFEDLAAQHGRPIFALIHVPSPHLPIVVDREGNVAVSPPGIDAYRQEPLGEPARTAYLDQVEFLSDRALDSVDLVLGTAPSARGRVVIVMSDHGAAVPPLAGEPWTADHYANFFAIHVTETLAVEFPSNTTPVNLLPTLLNASLGTDFGTWPDEQLPWDDAGQDTVGD